MVEWSNRQKSVVLGLQVFGLATPVQAIIAGDKDQRDKSDVTCFFFGGVNKW